MTSVLDKRARKKYLKVIRDAPFPFFAKRFLKIRLKKGLLAPFELNKAQLYAHMQFQMQIAKIGKVRAVVIKGRQQGFSTYIGGRFYKTTTERIGYSTYILSHESKTTGKLMEMVQRFHESCPDAIKPIKGSDNKKLGIKFPGLDASYELGTAKNPESGRGFTAQLFHGSEVAFWPFADQILAGVLQAVPDEPGTEIILESTANGVGGAFYQYVMDAYRGDGEFILIFSPWYWEDGYTQKPDANFVRTPEEKALAALVANHPDGKQFCHVLTDGQLAWRRKKIRELKNADLFRQEYPSHVMEAFLASGRPVFDVQRLVDAKTRCRLPVKLLRYQRGTDELRDEQNTADLTLDDPSNPLGYEFEAVADLVQVWAAPVQGRRYSIGADVAEGLEKGDYSAFDVHDEDGVQVAHYHGRIDVDTFAKLLNRIGRYYNDAFLGPERNNHGHAVILRLNLLDYRNLYVQEELDEGVERETAKHGWLTNAKTKPIIINELNALLLDENAGINCIHTIDQCLTYVFDKAGKMGAREGCFDDCVMSYAIALEMNRRMPRYVEERVQQAKSKSWML